MSKENGHNQKYKNDMEQLDQDNPTGMCAQTLLLLLTQQKRRDKKKWQKQGREVK